MSNTAGILWLVMVLVFGNIGFVSRLFSTGTADSEPVTEDIYMSTAKYHTDLRVGQDNAYTVKENLEVSFDTPRHGIYRYIPYKGAVTDIEENGDLTDIPYFARITDVHSDVDTKVSTENGNKVLRLGSEEMTVKGRQNYSLTYKVSPMTSKGYGNVYWNIYPTGWRNAIPAGSTFSVSFPKEFDHEDMTLYYGGYGQQLDASDITLLSWEGNTVTGVLKQALPVGFGLSVYVPMEKGYFTGLTTTWGLNIMIIAVSGIVLALLLLLFFLFGRDEPIIPSVQFKPPEGLDSASVGYIIDGNVSDIDMISLFIFWADRGYIKIRQTEENAISFIKLRDIPEDAPDYAVTLYNKVFPKGEDSIGREITMFGLKYELVDTFEQSKAMLRKEYKGLYTKQSRAARAIASVLSVIPVLLFTIILMYVSFANIVVILFAVLYLVGICMFNRTVDYWYSRARKGRRIWSSLSVAFCILPFVVLNVLYGIPMLKGSELNLFPALLCVSAASIGAMVLTGFMKKRTSQCVEWMGYLAGLRDFIETAELERMKVIAKDSPHLFYHILPFAYVFGLSDILLDKMKALTLPAPDWYAAGNSSPYFDYYLMHHMLHTNMTTVAQTITTPRPQESSSLSGGGFGGGFSGGGFSGGGFGGGGGGSW